MRFIFTRLYDFFQNRKPLLWSILLLLCILFSFAALRISFTTDVQKMIPQDEQIASLSNYLQHTKGAEKIVFGINNKDGHISTDELIAAKADYVRLLDSIGKEHIANIEEEPQGINEMSLYQLTNNYLPLLLTDSNYDALARMIEPDAIQAYLEQQYAMLQTPAGSFIAQTLPQDPIGANFLGMKRFLALNNNAYNIIDNGIFSADTQQVLFFLQSKYANGNNTQNKQLLASIKTTNKLFEATHPSLAIHYFGGALISVENALQMQQDTIVTLSITILALVALTWYVFKRKRIGLLLMMPVLFGILFSMAILGLFHPNIAVLALGVGAIILGIALDFSIHYLNHARSQTTSREDVEALALPLSLGAFTTIGAFFILSFAHSSVLTDIGLFASCALAGASLFTLIFLPHLVDLLKIKEQTNKTYPPTFIDKWALWQPEKSKTLLIGIFILTPILWFYSDRVSFNGDLMALNFLSEDLKASEAKFNNQTDQTLRSIYLISKDENKDEALSKSETITPILDSLKRAGNIKQYIHPATFLLSPKAAAAAQQKWESFWTDERIVQTQNAVNKAAAQLNINTNALISIAEFVHQKQYAYSDEDITQLLSMMPISISQYADTFAYITTVQTAPQDRNATIDYLRKELPQVVVTDNQSTVERLLDYLKEDFNNLAFYSGLLVFISLLIVYGRIELALIAFLPMAISWVWILGIMGIFGLEFNIVNIIICTLIFGLGDDYSIFMMDGLLEKYKYGKHKIVVSRSAIYLSALTTIIGLGVLIFAQHPALKGIALIAVIGITCVVLVAQILQPFLFNLLIQKRADKGKMPFTLWSLIKSIFAFSYFLFGCLLLTILGLILVYLKPLGAKRSKQLFHYCLSKYTKSVLYIMTNTKKTYHYADKNYFQQPAIYIANHSSFLDILITIGLHPKVILVTADWVWKSPVMGKIVQLAEFYPATEGANEGLAQLAAMRDKGYSIVIFPEGTRSKTDKILKFKKGAFFLAEQLQMDIQPLVLHGVGNTMEKDDFLLKDGSMNIYVLDKIKLDDARFGTTVAERRKKIARWFKDTYQEVRTQHETPSYFRETLIKGFIYKGPVVEWYARIKSKLEDNYEHYHQLLPNEGNFYDLGCGYGFMTFLLHWSGKQRRFIGIDYDEDKIETAQNHYYFNSLKYKERYPILQDTAFSHGLAFEQGDLTNIQLKSCHGILLMDALHYLLPEAQQKLLLHCYEVLLPGGILLLRDGVIEEGALHKNTERTELWSTKIIQFNKTKNELHFLNKTAIIDFFTALGAIITSNNYSKSLSNITFIIQKPNNTN